MSEKSGAMRDMKKQTTMEHFVQSQKEIDGNCEIEHQSEHIPRSDSEKQKEQYKIELLTMMVEVELGQMGYPADQVISFADQQARKMINQMKVQMRNLKKLAIYLKTYFQVKKQMPDRPAETMTEIPSQSWSNQSNGFSAPVYQIENREQKINESQLQRQAEPELLKEPKNILCDICLTKKQVMLTQSTPCHHLFCEDCMLAYIRQNASEGNFFIKCAEYNCQEKIHLKYIEEVLPEEEYIRFARFHEKVKKELNPDNLFCSKPDCEEVLEKQGSRLVCPKCSTKYCEVCLQIQHKGNTCQTALRKSLEHTYKALKIKKCPGCKSPIQKSDGCNHMTCKKCNYQFCWLCLSEYSRYHYKCYNFCGCPGMQYISEDMIPLGRAKQVCLLLFSPVIFVLFITAYLAAIPLTMLHYYFCKPPQWVTQQYDYFQRGIVNNCCGCFPEAIQAIFLWLLFQPRAILWMVFKAPIDVTAHFCRQLHDAVV